MILFFDTETTGLVNFKLPVNDASQPRLVQLAMILCEDDGTEKLSFSSIIRPDGFVIPENMVHGISNEVALKKGINRNIAINLFDLCFRNASIVVGHNIKFDLAVMEHELSFDTPMFDLAKSNDHSFFCTMLESVEVCKIPHPKWPNRYKWPRLNEAYKHFFNEELVGAHDALVDIRATKRVFFELTRESKSVSLNP